MLIIINDDQDIYILIIIFLIQIFLKLIMYNETCFLSSCKTFSNTFRKYSTFFLRSDFVIRVKKSASGSSNASFIFFNLKIKYSKQ